MFRFYFFALACALFLSCAQNNNSLNVEYQELAIRLGMNNLNKKSAVFGRADSIVSLAMFKDDLEKLFKKYPAPQSNTPKHINLLLMRTYNTMDAVIMREAPSLRDSLSTFIFFFALSQMNVLLSEKELLDGATLDDYIFAYTKYLPENKLEEPASRAFDTGYLPRNNPGMSFPRASHLMTLLTVRFQKPASYTTPTPGQKAFAFMRSRLLADKFNSSLSEKQKLLMKGASGDFIQSLSNKQAEMFREFELYTSLAE